MGSLFGRLTDNICFFLHTAERQRRSEEATARLSAASAAATARMQQQLRQLEHMELLQQQLQMQQLHGGNHLQQLLQQLQQGMEDSFIVLQQLKAFHKAVGEWLGGTETFVVYAAAALAAFVLTSTKRVAAARLAVLGLLCVAAAAEFLLHHGGLSPYLLQLSQQQRRNRSSAVDVAEGKTNLKEFFEELLWDIGSTVVAGVATHGVPIIRWGCLAVCCWLWARALRRYVSPEQLLQQQIQQLQQQVLGVRRDLHQAQQKRDPRNQELQHMLRQLLQCVAAEDSALEQLQRRQQHQTLLSKAEKVLQPQQQLPVKQSFLKRLLASFSSVTAGLLMATCAAAVAVTKALWRIGVFLFRLCCSRRGVKDSYLSNSTVVTFSKSLSAVPALKYVPCSDGSSGNKSSSHLFIRILRWQQQTLWLPAALKQQSKKHNEDEGEEADPTYVPSSRSSSCDSPLRSTAATDAEATAGMLNDTYRSFSPKEKQQRLHETPSPQPLRRNPPRKCRVTNYSKIVEPQHPDVFMREVIPVSSPFKPLL